MSQKWVGLVASGSKLQVVGATIPNNDEEPIIIEHDETWQLQSGDRSKAYSVLFQKTADFLEGFSAEKVVVKASAAPTHGAKLAHMEGAEVRGVVIAASASQCDVRLLPKALISRTFGSRKVDEYLKDQDFWEEQIDGMSLRVGSREAAMLLVAERSQ